MFTHLLSRLGGVLQFAMASALLAVSFLIQNHGIATYAGLPWLASMITALFVVGRVLAAGYWHVSPTLTVSIAVPLGLLRLALWVLALFCSIHFFLAHLGGVDLRALRTVTHLYHLPLTQTELLLSLSVFLALLLELALTVVLGHLARAYAPLLRAERDYRLHRYQYLTQVETELRLARATDQDLRERVGTERDCIEHRLRRVIATNGKLAE
ncbi:MAG: hypothetical protein IAF00_06295 [Phycisphaerales bacterium]|nr:hypothetical protein [Phycisphaerales bacterium]